MSTITSALSPSSEMSRLHRWAMWRMNVNEGIITCIREQGTARVLYPVDENGIAGSALGDNLSLRSGSAVTSAGDPTRPFLFISPEQMRLARTMNLRDKYGSGPGLSEDTYFIFGIPRISTYGKEIPEVKSQAGTQSPYSSSVDLRPITVDPGVFQSSVKNSHFRVSDLLLMSLEERTGRERDSTVHYQQGPALERRPLTTHPGADYYGDSGAVSSQAQGPFKPCSRSNLYSIHEDAELVNDNNDDLSNNNRSYQSERDFTRVSVPPTNTTFKEYDFNRLNNNNSDNASRFHSAHRSNAERSLPNSYAGSTMDETDLCPPRRPSKGPAPPVRPKPQGHLHSLKPVAGNQQGFTSQDVYPPFSPTRPGYSAATSLPRHNAASLSGDLAYPDRTGYDPSPPHRPNSRSPSPDRMRGSASSLLSAVGQGIVGPAGFLWDNTAERRESKARYDWSSPTTERDVVSDFSHYSSRLM